MLLVAALLAAGLALTHAAPAVAQGCGPANPNCIVPTRPTGDRSNAAASTAFVGTAITNLLATPNTWTATQTITLPTGLTSGLIVNTNGSGTTAANPFEYNQFNCITDNINSTNPAECVAIYHGYGGSSTQAARQSFLVNSQLLAATSASNPNRDYVAGVFLNSPLSGDGGGVGTEKGAFFGISPIVSLCATCANTAAVNGGEVDISIPVGASTLDKYGWSIVELSTDKVAGSRNDAAFLFGNQVGAVGWGTLIQVGDGLNQAPLKTTGSIMAAKGAQTVAHGLDFTNITCSSDCIKVPGGNVYIGTPVTTTFQFAVQKADSSSTALFAGTTKGVRIGNTSTNSAIEGVDNTGAGSFQPLFLNGTTLTFQTGTSGGVSAVVIDANVHVDTTASLAPGLSTCGTSPTISGNDWAGDFHTGTTTGTACTVTFSHAFIGVPYCLALPKAGGTAPPVATTNSSMTFSSLTSSTDYVYHCFGPPGG
jgi:hypothetical protein